MRQFLIALFLVVFVSGIAYAEPGYKLNILSETENELKVEVTVNNFKVEEMEKWSCVYIPGTSMIMKKGFPLLPKLGKLVKINDTLKPEMEIISKEEIDVPIKKPIVPSKGHLTRNINPANIPLECGNVYKEDKYWPCEEHQLTMGKPFLFNKLRGLRIQMLPIRVNHVKMNMKVIKKMVISFKFKEKSYSNVIYRYRSETVSKDFSDIYAKTFANYTASTTRGEMPVDQKRLLVVVANSFKSESTINSWISHKENKGYTVTRIDVADGTSADTIKSSIQNYYDAGDLGYVVLIGDSNTIPTFRGSYESAHADRVYVRLNGTDNYPDAFISRISARSTGDVKAQLDKVMYYENNANGASYQNSALLIASNQGSPSDYARTNWLINGGHSGQKYTIPSGDGLKGNGYTNCQTQYDPSASSSGVKNVINSGVGVICYVGHGSSTSWVSSGFGNSHIASLTNQNEYPVIWSVACVNGNFANYDACFAETFLRKANGGAVAMEASSTNEAWVPPCDKQAASLHSQLTNQGKTFGYHECVGCIVALEEWGDGNRDSGNQLAEQCNLFGDCSMIVYKAK